MCTHIITISGEKLDKLGKLLDHKHNINFSTKFSIYEKVPFTGADISESNTSKDKLRQQAKDIIQRCYEVKPLPQKESNEYVIAARDLNLSNGKELTKGKSYNILVETADWYKVINDLGKEVSYLKTFFNKKSEEVKSLQIQSPKEEEESIPAWMEGFEDLVRSDYKLKHHNYLVLDKLSVEQKDFLQNNFDTFSGSTFLHNEHIYAVWHSVYQKFLGRVFDDTPEEGKEIFFNDLFVPKP